MNLGWLIVMEELLKFKYKDYELVLLYDKEKVYYAKRVNNVLSYDISDNDRALLKFVYKKVMPSNNLGVRKDINYQNKTYKHLVDKNNSLHLFYELKDNELCIPDLEVRKKLNYLYNNQEALVYEMKDKANNHQGFFKRVIKIGKKSLLVFVATSVVLGHNYLNANKNVVIEDEPPIIVEDYIPSPTIDDSAEDFIVADAIAFDDGNVLMDDNGGEEEEEERHIPQYFDKTPWVDVAFKNEEENPNKKWHLEELVNSYLTEKKDNENNQTKRDLLDDELREIYMYEDIFYDINEMFLSNPDFLNYDILINYKGQDFIATYDKKINFISYTSKRNLALYDKLDFDGFSEITEKLPDLKLSFVKKKNIHLNYDDIAKLLNYNTNLTKEEKEFILSNPKFISDNLNYMDHNYVFEMLLNLNTKYINKDSGRGVAGEYYSDSYKITLYDTPDFSNCNKAVFTHELSHAFSCPTSGDNTLYIEIINNIVNNEYWGKGNCNYDLGYRNVLNKAYMLLELFNPEEVRMAYFQKDVDALKKSLMNIIDSEDMANELFECLDASVNDLLLTAAGNNQNTEELRMAINQRFNDLVKMYYEAKYHKPIEENEELMFNGNYDDYLGKLSVQLLSDDARMGYRSDILSRKAYFNDALLKNMYTTLNIYGEIIENNGTLYQGGGNSITSLQVIYSNPKCYGLNVGVLNQELER